MSSLSCASKFKSWKASKLNRPDQLPKSAKSSKAVDTNNRDDSADPNVSESKESSDSDGYSRTLPRHGILNSEVLPALRAPEDDLELEDLEDPNASDASGSSDATDDLDEFMWLDEVVPRFNKMHKVQMTEAEMAFTLYALQNPTKETRYWGDLSKEEQNLWPHQWWEEDDDPQAMSEEDKDIVAFHRKGQVAAAKTTDEVVRADRDGSSDGSNRVGPGVKNIVNKKKCPPCARMKKNHVKCIGGPPCERCAKGGHSAQECQSHKLFREQKSIKVQGEMSGDNVVDYDGDVDDDDDVGSDGDDGDWEGEKAVAA